MNEIGINKVLEIVKQKMDSHGFAIVNTMGVKDGIEVPYSYTVGLSNFNHPEISMAGLEHSLMNGLLNQLGSAVVKGTQKYLDNGLYDGVILSWPVAIKAPLSTVNPRQYFAVANQVLSNHEYEVVQLIIPDINGLFPWEPGCSPELTEAQCRLMPLDIKPAFRVQ